MSRCRWHRSLCLPLCLLALGLGVVLGTMMAAYARWRRLFLGVLSFAAAAFRWGWHLPATPRARNLGGLWWTLLKHRF